MKILAISDKESPALWDYFDAGRLEDIDVILSCGDLDPRYLSFLTTFFSGPVLYVHGNHDEGYDTCPPEGCICIEDRIYEYKGVRFLGLGGSMRYKPGPHQYTQQEMDRRIRKLWFPLMRHGGFDVLVTHAPARGLGDGSSLTHTGFNGFIRLLDRYSPRFFVHGHIHLNYGGHSERVRQYKNTTVINAYERYVFDTKPVTNPLTDSTFSIIIALAAVFRSVFFR